MVFKPQRPDSRRSGFPPDVAQEAAPALPEGFSVLGNPVCLMRYFARPNLAPAFLAIAGYSTQRATLKASMCIEAVEARAALPSGSIVRAHARDPRTRIRYTPAHPAPALVCMSVLGSITWHPPPLAANKPLCGKGSMG